MNRKEEQNRKDVCVCGGGGHKQQSLQGQQNFYDSEGSQA
jgi:hypothetical protein